ncbi:hypothetical protein SNEBB_005135 [Seison nebaliae]|nr:hypothetical protein SNEBB_005135 [Seison nebaliae]
MWKLNILVCCLVVLEGTFSVPLKGQKKEAEKANVTDDGKLGSDMISKLEYEHYLREVISVLESDESFRTALANTKPEDIKSGKIADNLPLVSHSVRSRLDELKRREIERLSQLVEQQKTIESRKDVIDNIRHLHHESLGENFSEKDLKHLIKQVTKDLDEIDQERRREFHRYEIEKEHQRRAALDRLSPEERKEAEKKYEEEKKLRQKHKRVHHPGSRGQFKEVWKEKDHQEADQFNPHTFFAMHDTDNNLHLDELELEALFNAELDKLYDSKNGKVDEVERDEERNRMREHVMKEFDTNGDRMVSLDEFMIAMKKQEEAYNKQQQDPNRAKRHQNQPHPSQEAPKTNHEEQPHLPDYDGSEDDDDEDGEEDGWKTLSESDEFNEEEYNEYLKQIEVENGRNHDQFNNDHPDNNIHQPSIPQQQEQHQNINQQQQQHQNINQQQQQHQNINQQQQQHQNINQQQQHQNINQQQQHQNINQQQQQQNINQQKIDIKDHEVDIKNIPHQKQQKQQQQQHPPTDNVASSKDHQL